MVAKQRRNHPNLRYVRSSRLTQQQRTVIVSQTVESKGRRGLALPDGLISISRVQLFRLRDHEFCNVRNMIPTRLHFKPKLSPMERINHGTVRRLS
jgi:hypothetical protein